MPQCYNVLAEECLWKWSHNVYILRLKTCSAALMENFVIHKASNLLAIQPLRLVLFVRLVLHDGLMTWNE